MSGLCDQTDHAHKYLWRVAQFDIKLVLVLNTQAAQ
jgi:hypothetical protein